MDIQNKTVVITGAGRGLGRAMALSLAQAGANLALIDLDKAGLEQTRTLCQAAGSQAEIYVANVCREDEVITTFQQIQNDLGAVSGLINNAGIIRDGLLVKAKDGLIEKRMSLQEWQAVIDVNLTGVFLCGREAASQMVAQQQAGVIINISSVSRAGNVGQSNYSAAKAGVAAMTVTWAKELARYQIRSAAIAPGFIRTEILDAMKPEALDKMAQGIPLKRIGNPEEIADTALFIFKNDYITGRIFEVDGGIRL
ncbi:MAG TPA: SDR family oxidoreductase [Pseudomonadales bacterium]|nr:SDR family oxidoreductase [Pseudomonadales bacterium]